MPRRRLPVLLLLLLVGAAGLVLRRGRGSDRDRLNRIARGYQAGEVEATIERLHAYLDDYPGDATAWVVMGNACKDLRRDAEAEAAYGRALEIDARDVGALTGMGIVHRRRGELEEAVGFYRRALEVDPGYAQAHTSLVVIRLKQGKTAEALEHGLRAWALDPEDPTVAANLAVACHYAGDLERRDEMTATAERLGYANLEALRRIYAGELDVRD